MRKLIAVVGVAAVLALLASTLVLKTARAPSPESPSVAFSKFESDAGSLEVGVGIYDVTGPAAEVNLMGYAMAGQVSAGIHIRTFSRAFVFHDPSTSKRVAFVSFDGGMASDLVKMKVLQRLNQLIPGMYKDDNVCISGTHTHSATAGFLQYVLFQVTSLGYVKQSAEAFSEGIAQSIYMAHKNVQPASVSIAQGLLSGANINRSPSSYMANPEAERNQYLSVGNDTDHNMVLLKILSTKTGASMGMLNWFAVHGTSMNHTNKLISGDNKGYASLAVEKSINSGSLLGRGPFVAGFAQTNLGDVSPNTAGPRCLDSGLPCDVLHSTCHGKNELCAAFGPGRDMFESTEIIGRLQADKALELWKIANTPLTGPVDYIHQYVHMPSYTVNNRTLCTPAMGYAFAAGTTDGCGMFNFQQGTISGNPFWDAVSSILAKPSEATKACHAPKPILLDTGDISKPYQWDPHIVPMQILRIGQLVILSVSSELTTMAGRRLRNAVKQTLISKGVLTNDGVVVIAGLANSYSSYVTTFEEYQRQRYEAASTLYGPHTLEAYIQKMNELAIAMAEGRRVDPGPSPPNYESQALSFLPPVIVDGAPPDHPFGSVVTQPLPSYNVGATVFVTFQSANPRNNLRTQDTFLEVQIKNSDGTWSTVATDTNWETKYRWYRHHFYSDFSYADITWDIPEGTFPGTYRIVHYGDHKNILQMISPFTGISNEFSVLP